MNYIRETIAELDRQFAALIKRGHKLLDALVVLSDLDPGVKPPAESQPRSPAVRQPRPTENGASKYRGVSAGKARKAGTIPWRAQVWDPRQRKNISLGSTFETPELAAAAIAEFKGDKREASRLRDLAGQVDNNADAAPPAASQSESNQANGGGASTHFECNKCASPTASDTMPESCSNCGNKSFTRILPNGRGASDYVGSPDE